VNYPDHSGRLLPTQSGQSNFLLLLRLGGDAKGGFPQLGHLVERLPRADFIGDGEA